MVVDVLCLAQVLSRAVRPLRKLNAPASTETAILKLLDVPTPANHLPAHLTLTLLFIGFWGLDNALSTASYVHTAVVGSWQCGTKAPWPRAHALTTVTSSRPLGLAAGEPSSPFLLFHSQGARGKRGVKRYLIRLSSIFSP